MVQTTRQACGTIMEVYLDFPRDYVRTCTGSSVETGSCLLRLRLGQLVDTDNQIPTTPGVYIQLRSLTTRSQAGTAYCLTKLSFCYSHLSPLLATMLMPFVCLKTYLKIIIAEVPLITEF